MNVCMTRTFKAQICDNSTFYTYTTSQSTFVTFVTAKCILTFLWIIHRAETERGLSRKHIIEGKKLFHSIMITTVWVVTSVTVMCPQVSEVLCPDCSWIMWISSLPTEAMWTVLWKVFHFSSVFHSSKINVISLIKNALVCFTEVVRAMTFVINQGMAMYWGTSRWSAMEIMVCCALKIQCLKMP